jgi:diguanylate cyclase (GGDEF)-like protein
MRSSVSDEAVVALERYLAAEARRDLAGMLDLLSPAICGFGTGPDEIVLDHEAVRTALTRQFGELTGPMETSLEILRTVDLGADGCVVMAIITIRIFLPAGEETMAVRMTFALHRGAGGWQVAHLHASMPWSMQRAGESFPGHELAERNRRLALQVEERTRELGEALAMLQRVATTDKLTGLHNRTRIDELLADEHRYQQRHPRPASIALLDIDHFKAINDTHGHLAGDRVLHDAAREIAAGIRDIDRLGRWGGEEFLVLMPEASAEQAAGVTDRIRRRVASASRETGTPITFSGGVAQYRDGESVDAWLGRADRGLYRAKAEGRDRTVVEG